MSSLHFILSTNPIQPSTQSKTGTQVIEIDGRPAAYLVRSNEWPEGLSFITPDETFIQVGTWRYEAGKQLAAHVHKDYPRQATKTQEVVFVKQGRMRTTLYDKDRQPVKEIILETGDLLIITEAGYGYEILSDDTQILEAKNGPFVSVEKDKEKFSPSTGSG